MPESATELGERVARVAATMTTPEAEAAMRSHMVWLIRQMFSHITPADLTATELASLVAVLVIPHSRWLDSTSFPVVAPGARPNLTVVPTGWMN